MTHISLPILVADQDDVSRNRLADVLAEEGFQPLPARTGGEAVELVRNRVVAVTILDVALPDFSGIEAFRLITDIRSGVPGIFLARDRSTSTMARLLDAGAYTVLGKPPRIAVLMEALRGLASRFNSDGRFKNY